MIRYIAIAAIALSQMSACSNAASDRYPVAERKEVRPSSNVQKCSDRYQLLDAPQIDPGLSARQILEGAFSADRMVGVEENIKVMRDSASANGFLRVHYPEGSINFGSVKDGHPLGGASFYVPYFQGNAACLQYRVRFANDFAFRKGGKLPGLYEGVAPSGGDEVTGDDGWSIRLMWRKEGKGELYEYIVNKKGKYGASVGRGLYDFPRGRWVTVDLEVKKNDPGEANGIARLWIDGRPVIEQNDIVYTASPDARGGGGLMFSTFFGGGDKSWASPKDQYIDFADFRFYGEGSKR